MANATPEAGRSARPEASPNGLPRTPAEIEAHIESTVSHLARTIDQISGRVSPKELARRGASRVKDQFVDAEGRPRLGRVAVAGVATVALVATLAWRKRR